MAISYAKVKIYFVWNSLIKKVESGTSSVMVEGPVKMSSSTLQLAGIVECLGA